MPQYKNIVDKFTNLIISKSGNKRAAISVFETASKVVPSNSNIIKALLKVTQTPIDYSSLSLDSYSFNTVAKTLSVNDALLLLESNSSLISINTFHFLIKRLIDDSLYKNVFRVHDAMIMKRLKPTIQTYTIMISNQSKIKDVIFVNQVLDLVKFMGIDKDLVFYSCLIDFSFAINDVKRVLDLLQEMNTDNIPLDTTLINILITGFSKTDSSFINEYLLKMYNENIQPDKYTLTALIDHLLKSNMLSDALSWFSTLTHEQYHQKSELQLKYSNFKKVVPDVTTHTAIIDGLFRLNEHEKAQEWFEKMLETTRPNVYTFSTLVKWLCSRGDYEKAELVFKRISQVGLEPDIPAYNCLLNGYMKQGVFEFEKALTLVNEMESKFGNVPVDTYSMFLKHVINSKNSKGACEIFTLINSRGLVNEHVLSLMIPFICHLDVILKVKNHIPMREFSRKTVLWLHGIFTQYAKFNYSKTKPPPITIFDSFISYYLFNQNNHQVEAVISEMTLFNVEPDFQVFAKLSRVYVSDGWFTNLVPKFKRIFKIISTNFDISKSTHINQLMILVLICRYIRYYHYNQVIELQEYNSQEFPLQVLFPISYIGRSKKYLLYKNFTNNLLHFWFSVVRLKGISRDKMVDGTSVLDNNGYIVEDHFEIFTFLIVRYLEASGNFEWSYIVIADYCMISKTAWDLKKYRNFIKAF